MGHTTLQFLRNLRMGPISLCYITLGCKGLPVKISPAYWALLQVTKKMRCCLFNSYWSNTQYIDLIFFQENRKLDFSVSLVKSLTMTVIHTLLYLNFYRAVFYNFQKKKKNWPDQKGHTEKTSCSL
jgi:hypothetical protein